MEKDFGVLEKIVKRFTFLIAPLVFSLVFLGVPIPSFAQTPEQLTITTYYPSPAGSFNELRTNSLAVGSAYRNSPLSDGWLIVSGMVGIGTDTPTVALHVLGDTRTEGQSTQVGHPTIYGNPTIYGDITQTGNINLTGTLSATNVSATHLSVSGGGATLAGGNHTINGDLLDIDTGIGTWDMGAGNISIGIGNKDGTAIGVGIGNITTGWGWVGAPSWHVWPWTGAVLNGHIGPVLGASLLAWLLSAAVIAALLIALFGGSSARYKENIKPLDSALEKVMKLRGVNFDWKANKKHSVGLVAEEVGEVFPELLIYDQDNKTVLGFRPDGITAALVEAVKTQQKQIGQLTQEVNSLKKAMAVNR